MLFMLLLFLILRTTGAVMNGGSGSLQCFYTYFWVQLFRYVLHACEVDGHLHPLNYRQEDP